MSGTVLRTRPATQSITPCFPASRVKDERVRTSGRVELPRCVSIERRITSGRVVGAGGVAQERLKTAGRAADPLIWFSESGFIGVFRGQNSFLGLEPINQPQIDTDFWSLPAASRRVHIRDDVCQRCGAGEHKRPLPVDSR
jgi:hypothetical protein